MSNIVSIAPASSRTKTAIYEAAKALFWKHGIRKTSVEEICREADVSKMTFYRHFDNKLKVAELILEGFHMAGYDGFEKIMETDEKFSVKMRRLIELKHQMSQDISLEFVRDVFEDSDSDLAKAMEHHRKKSETQILKHFQQAQKDGWIRKDLNLQIMLGLMRQLSSQLSSEIFMGQFENTSEAIVELTKFFVYGIQPIEE